MQPVKTIVSDDYLNMVFGNLANGNYFYQGLKDLVSLPAKEETIKSNTSFSPDEINYEKIATVCPSCRSSKLAWRGNWVRCTCCGEVILKKERLIDISRPDSSSLRNQVTEYEKVNWIDLSDIKVDEKPTKFEKLKYKLHAVFAA